MKHLLAELKRRNIFRVGATYAVVAWLLMQVGVVLETSLRLPDWFDTVVTVALLIGFPIALIITWAFELTPEGVRRTLDLDDADESALPRADAPAVAGVEDSTPGPSEEFPRPSRSNTPVVSTAIAAAVVVLFGTWWFVGRSAPVSHAINSLAVLPLSNLAAADQGYFVDGMHDAMISELAKVSDLTVLSRTSVLRFRDTEESTADIARDLGVDGLIVGSVYRAGDSVRINVQLVQPEPEKTLWTDSYEGSLGEALGLHRRVARAVAQEVKVSLAPSDQRRLAAVDPISPEAQEAYLRGLAALRTRTFAGIDSSIVLLRRAVRLEPNFADGWGVLSEAESFWATYRFSSEPQSVVDSAMTVALGSARRALAIDDAQPAAVTVLGRYENRNDADAAITGLRRATEINPNYAQAWNLLGDVLRVSGDLNEALEAHRRAQLLDPLHPVFSRDVAWSLLYVGRYADAEHELRRALALEPDVLVARSLLVQTLLLQEKWDAAAAEERTQLRELGASDSLIAAFQSVVDNDGWHAAMSWLMTLTSADLPASKSSPEYGPLALPQAITPMILAWQGDTEAAIRRLQEVADHGYGWRYYIDHPFFESLHDDPRYQEIKRRQRGG